MIRLAWQNLAIKLHSTINLSKLKNIIWKILIQKFKIKQYIWQKLTNHIFWQHSKNIYNKTVIIKQAWIDLQAQYESCSYYQSSVHIFYSQFYFISMYLSQNKWFSQEYNNYWENKIQQQDSTFQNLTFQNNQSALLASKQFLMIIADTAIASESWSIYSNFEQEVNFHYNQNQYK